MTREPPEDEEEAGLAPSQKDHPQSWDHIRGVTFDVVGTLIAVHPFVGKIYSEVLERHKITIQPTALGYFFRRAYADAQNTPRGSIDNESEKKRWREIVQRIIGDYCRKDEFSSVFEELYETFASGSRWKTIVGAADVLDALKRRGYRVAVLSNTDSRIRSVLNDLCLDVRFEALFLSTETHFEKPDRRAFQFVESRLGISADQMLHVGDSRGHDEIGALRAGWHSVRIGSPVRLLGTRSKTIASLYEILNLLPQR